jgi:patatin-like phospholipase/acyl hydrolase
MFRALAIDGGGVRGFLAASILANIEAYLDDATGERRPLGRRFDLISGTSAGGLVALGLGMGRTAAEVRDLFLALVPAVFGDANRREMWHRPKKPRYHSEPLQKALVDFFQDATLGDLVVDVCVTSVSLIDAKPRMHKTDYLARNAGRLGERLVDVGLATTAAPTYLKAHSSTFSANLVDGGLAANNPALVALVDALQFERRSKRGAARPTLNGTSAEERLVMISVGTGQPGPLPYDHEKLVDGGWFDWLLPILEVVQLSQAQLVHHQAKFLLGDHYLRIDPVLNVPVKLDDAKRFLELRNKADIDEATERFLKQFFLAQ